MNRTLVFTVAALIALLSVSLAYGETEVSGDQAGTWTLANSPYIVTGWVNVLSGQTLTIQPGVTVKFNENQGVSIYGVLIADGTSSQKITFTSNGALEPDWWNSIQFHGGSSSTLDWCVIKYGGHYENANIVMWEDASPTISNSEISYSDADGIRLEDTSSPSISGNTISHNDDDGIEVNDNASPKLTDNTITDNDNPVWITSGAAVVEFVNNRLTGNREYDGVVYSGDIPENTSITWDIASVPYVIESWLTIGTGATLNIPAGMVVKFEENQGIDVHGTLTAVGTSTRKIIFTALTDDSIGGDTNRDGDDSSPEGDYWNSIQFHSGSSGTLDWCVIKYGGHYENANLVMWGDASPTISNSEISYSDADGIRLEDSSSPSISGSTISHNDDDGIEVNDNASPTLTDNTITDNDNPVWITSGTAVVEFVNNRLTGNREYDGVVYSGDIPDNTSITWDIASVPYVIESWLTIGTGATLEIPAGMVVKFEDNQGIDVYGTLIAVGTSTEKIVFTALTDDSIGGDTNRDGEDSSPEGDYWNSIQFHDGSRGTLDWCVIKYGGHYENANIVMWGDASPTISNSEISYSDADGIRCYDAANPTISGSTIGHNGDDGIEVNDNASPILTDNTITDNDSPVWITSGTAVVEFVNNRLTGNREYDGVVYSGDIPDNTSITWDIASVPYVIESWLTIGTGATLNIPAGMVVKFEENQGIGVHGTLTAVGTSTEKIVFTALTDDSEAGDTNRDGDDSSPEGDYWNSIQFHGGSSGTLDWCVIRYGGYYENANIAMWGNASPTISNSEISYSDADGIRCYDATNPTISPNNIIANNGDYGVRNYGDRVTVNARNNWWGDTSGPYHETQNPDGKGNQVSDHVDFEPYMKNPPTVVEDTTPPVITIAPSVSNITSSSATITWTTDEVSSSVVEYGTTIDYGLSATGTEEIRHRVTLIGLVASTTYHYRVGSTDASGNKTWSGDYTFTTLRSQITGRTLSITSAEAAPDTNISVQLSISNATGLTGGDILVKYNTDVITVGEVIGTDLISNINLIINKDTPGEITLSMAGTKEIPSGSGAMVEMTINVSADAEVGTETTLEFGDTEIYDQSGATIPVNLENGVVKITQPGIKGDVNNDGRVRSNDAILSLRIAAGLMQPTEYQKWAADMNGDGRVRSNDAILILRTAAGLAAPSKESVASIEREIAVILGEAHGLAGESVTVPLKVDDIRELASGDVRIAYDRTVLRAIEVLSDADVLLQSKIDKSGVIQISFASNERLMSETVAEIQFDILADNVSPLKLQQVQLYSSDARPVISRKIDGQFSSWAIPPEHSALLPNFPNPFNPETWIPYQLASGGEVTIRIYNVKGQLIKTLALGYQPAGIYTHRSRAAYWDGKNEQGNKVASGVYFYQLHTGQFTALRKLIVLK